MNLPALLDVRCLICAYPLSTSLFNGGRQPLATLGWPQSLQEAQSMARLPHDFVQCPRCAHVWNRSFRYDDIPYRDNPNRMFNQGSVWGGHLAHTRDAILDKLPESPTVVDIGCGEGHFARGMAEARGGRGRYLGFDPSTSAESGAGVEFHARLFSPLVDMLEFKPDAVVIRHVLEHLTDPGKLLSEFAWGAHMVGKPCWLFAETPCIDRVFETGRLSDFTYEHLSHFSTQSFERLMSDAGEIAELSHGYDGEVVYALVELRVPETLHTRADAAQRFAARVDDSRVNIGQQLAALAAGGKKVAVWGGTGKAAVFIHQFNVDVVRFPLVVDSDRAKVGTHVPGAGQLIRYRDELKTEPVDVVIIPAQWRAKDIVAEMRREGIAVREVLIEHGGRLVDFVAGEHPYSR